MQDEDEITPINEGHSPPQGAGYHGCLTESAPQAAGNQTQEEIYPQTKKNVTFDAGPTALEQIQTFINLQTLEEKAIAYDKTTECKEELYHQGFTKEQRKEMKAQYLSPLQKTFAFMKKEIRAHGSPERNEAKKAAFDKAVRNAVDRSR